MMFAAWQRLAAKSAVRGVADVGIRECYPVWRSATPVARDPMPTRAQVGQLADYREASVHASDCASYGAVPSAKMIPRRRVWWNRSIHWVLR